MHSSIQAFGMQFFTQPNSSPQTSSMIQKKIDSIRKKVDAFEAVSFQPLDTNDQKMIQKFVQANSESCDLLKSGLIDKALQILEASERRLKQMTENGQNLGDVLFAATLQNISAAHQRSGNYNKSLDYIRALLYSLNSRILKVQKQNGFEFNLASFNMDINIAKCYIYFLSLTIQLKMLEAAIVPANRALEFFKKFCKNYHKSGLNLQLINTKMNQKLFLQIEQFQTLRLNTTEWELMDNLKGSFGKLKNLPYPSTLELLKLKRFSLANLTKINEVQVYIKEGKVIQKYSGNKGFENGFIEFAVCLFLIGKSLHQSSLSKNKKQEAAQRVALQDRIKQHILWSLYFACQLCPFFTQLHKEIFDFYDNNFGQQIQNLQGSKKLKSFDSLQMPSLKDSEAWKDIKKRKLELENERNLKVASVKEQDIPILNEKEFYKNLQSEKTKLQSKDKLFDKKRFSRHRSHEMFRTQRMLFHQKTKNQKSTSKKQISPILKKICNNPSSESKKKKNAPGQKKKKNQGKRSSSEKSISLSKGRNLFSNNAKKIHTQKKFDEFLEEYFPKFPDNKKKDKNRDRLTVKFQEKKQFVANSSNLQKKIREATKSLSLSKKSMFRSPKKK